jgi:hypothetical protein
MDMDEDEDVDNNYTVFISDRGKLHVSAGVAVRHHHATRSKAFSVKKMFPTAANT